MASTADMEGTVAAINKLPAPRALIIVDVQNDFCDGGALAVPKGSEVVPFINKLRESCHFERVVLTQDWHPADHASFAANNDDAELFSVRELPGMGQQVMWPVHCVQGSAGAEFHASLTRGAGDVVVRKGTHARVDSYSGFGDGTPSHSLEKTEMNSILRGAGIASVVVVGLALDYCVAFTARDAVAEGFAVACVLAGCRGIAHDSIQAQLAAMRSAGVTMIE